MANNNATLQRFNLVCDEFEDAWLAGGRPSIPEYLEGSQREDRRQLFIYLLELEIDYRCQAAETPDADDYKLLFPLYVNEIGSVFNRISQEHQAPPSTPDDPIGSQQQAPEDLGAIREYQLLSKLGQGGMGVVYKSLHKSLQKVVALKVLTNQHSDNGHFDDTAVARFQREMKAVGKLDHPNIVRAMDAGEFEGHHFLVMELVNGRNLSEILKLQGRLKVADACELVRQAALGLQEAHEHDMVHRDIKPSNLMLSVKRRKKKSTAIVKILDMGLALLAEPGAENDELTDSGVLMGTIDYMAPEQATDTHTVDIRADIYSLGATLYKLLTGVSPYQESRYDSAVKRILAIVNETPPSVQTRRSNLPPVLVSLVDRMMAKEKSARPATPEEVATALAPFADGHNIAALAAEGPEPDVDKSLEASLLVSLQTHVSDVASTPDPSAETDVSPHSFTLESRRTPLPGIALQRPDLTIPQRKTDAVRKGVSSWLFPAIAGCGGIALLIAAIVFFLPTKDGSIRVEINDPSIKVSVKGTGIVFTGAGKQPVSLTPGEHILHVTRGDFKFDTDKLVLKNGEKVVVKAELIDGEIRLVTSEGLPLGSHSIAGPTAVKPPTPGAPPTRVKPAGHPKAPGQYSLKFASADHGVVATSVSNPKSMTLEMWIKRDTAKCYVFGILQDISLRGSVNYGGRALEYRWPNEVISTGSRSEEANAKWTHIAAVRDWEKTECRFYVNGKLEDKKPFAPEKLRNAKDGSLILALNISGSIGETRVSSIPRYEEEFVPAVGHKPDEHTLVLYKFEEGKGDVLKDSSGNENHGKIAAGTKWVKIDSL